LKRKLIYLLVAITTLAGFFPGALPDSSPTPARASAPSIWPSDPAVNLPISTSANSSQAWPVITLDNSGNGGGAIMAWQDFRNGEWDIYAQRVDETGAVLWTAGGVPVKTGDFGQQAPAITHDNAGGAIIAWQDSRVAPWDIYAQRIDSNGVPQWAAGGVAISTAANQQTIPQIIADGFGGAVISWWDTRSGNPDIYAQLIDSNGVTQWTADGVAIASAAATQNGQAMVRDVSANATIIAWQDNRSGNYDIYAQRVSANGTAQWTANGTAVYTGATDQVLPAMSYDGAGGAIVTWEDIRSGAADIYAQRLNAAGATQWDSNGVAVTTANGTQNFQSMLAAVSANGTTIAWQDNRNGNWDIYGQRLDLNGAALWTANGTAISTATGDQTNPRLSDPANDASISTIITWQDTRNGNSDIFAQRVSIFGVAMWTTNGVPVSIATGNQISQRMALKSAGPFIVVWADTRNGNDDIYAQGINGDGTLGPLFTAPAVTTGNATNITPSSATLSGSLTALGTATAANVSIEWGLTANYTASSPAISMNATGAFSANVTGLSGNTTYHFRAKAVGNGVGLGGDNVFTTNGTSPVLPVNVIRNGDFNNGLDNWNVNPKLPQNWNPLNSGGVNLHPPLFDFRGVILYQNVNVPDIGGRTFNLSLNLTKLGTPPSGNSTAVWVFYVDTANVTQRIRILNPDNASISTNSLVSGNITFPAAARKLVKVELVKENSGEFVVDNVSFASFGVIPGLVPIVSMVTGSGFYSSTVNITGSFFTTTPGRVRIAGSEEGLVITDWTDTTIRVTLAEPARGGRVVVVADGVESNIEVRFEVRSPHFTVDLLRDTFVVVRGQTFVVPVRVDLRNGFITPGGVTLEFTTGNASAVTITPAVIRTSGGVALRIDTTNWSAGTHVLTVRTVEAASLPRTVTVTVRVVSTSSIRFWEFDLSNNRVYLTTNRTTTRQGSLQIFAEGIDSDGNLMVAPLTLESDNSSSLEVTRGSFMGYNIYALRTGSPRLIARAPDGFSANLTVNIIVPADPAITSITLTPQVITNKHTDNLTFSATGTRAIGWEIIGLISDHLTGSNMDWSNSNMTFGGSFRINPANRPDLGTYLFGAFIQSANLTRLAEAALPLTIVNDPSFSGIRGGVFSLDPSLPGFAMEMFNLEFHQGGSVNFTRNVFMHPMGGEPLFELGAIPPGTYKIRYAPFGGSPTMPSPKPQWYPNADNISGAIDVTFTAGQVTPNIYFFPVANPTITAVTVLPSNPSLLPGQTLQFNATGIFSDNTTANITSTVFWMSNNPSVASISSGGLATASSPGTTNITAMAGTVSGSTTLTVTANQTGPKPDLIISEKHEEWIQQGISYRVFYTVQNIGTANASAGHDVSLSVDGSPLEQIMIPVTLLPGAFYSGNFSANVTLSGVSDNITVTTDINAEVDELNETNNSLINIWPPPPKPDLIISEKHEQWIQPGVSYRVFYTVQNIGSANASAGHDVFLGVDENPIEQQPVPVPLGPGASYTGNFTAVVSLSGGFDGVHVRADINNEVDESDEKNNRRVNTFAWPAAPDLVVSHKSEQWVQQGGQYRVYFDVRNIGNAVASANHSAALSIDGTEIERIVIGTDLAPGQSYGGVFNTSVNITGGADKIRVTADITNMVAESIEVNNSATNTFAWPPAPDLIVDVKYEYWLPTSTTQYRVNFAVLNIGNADAAAGHDVELKVDGVVIETIPIWMLLYPSTGSIGVFSSVLTLSGTSDNITVTADINNEVPESDEANNSIWNIWSAQQLVQKPDLIISEKHEEWIQQGISYRVFYTVQNIGTANASAGHDVSLSVDGSPLEQRVIPVTLLPGAFYSGNFSANVTLSGVSDNITVTADINAEVDELNEANNSLINIWPPSRPDLVISEKHENWVVAGVSYTISYTIKNQGSATVPAGHLAALMVDLKIIETRLVTVPIAPGANFTDNFTTVVTLTGSVDAVNVFADYSQMVNESNEGNNIKINTFAWPPAPDLAVNKSERWVQEGSQYIVDFSVTNRGNASAPSGHDVSLMIDEIVTETMPVPVTLVPGGTYSGTFNTTANLSGGVDKIIVTTDANNEVAESNEGNNTWVNTFAWPAKPDLTFRMKWEEWLPGSNTQYRVFFRLLNLGNAATPAGHRVQIMADGVVIDTIQIPVVMNTGDVFQGSSANVSTLTGGSDNVTITADIDNIVAESDETNNSRWNIWSAPPPAPDLTIIEKHEEWIVQGSIYRVFFMVKNTGGAVAVSSGNTTFEIGLQINGVPMGQVSVPNSLAPGENWTASFSTNVTLSPAGFDMVGVQADVNNEIMEMDEGNNWRFNVISWPAKPNLHVQKWEEWQGQTQTYIIRYTVWNNGDAPASAGHDVQLKIDGVVLETRVIPVALNPGQGYGDVFNYTANLTGGVDSIAVTADINNEVVESVEGDNTMINTLSQPAKPDLIIKWKNEQWLQGQEGTSYNVVFTVENIGNDVAAAGHGVGLWIDGNLIEHRTIPFELSPSQRYSALFTAAINLSGGSDNITVIADATNVVNESIENNNSLTNIWPPQGTGLAVTIVAPAKVGVNRDFTASVNIGQVQNLDAANFDVSFNPAVLRLDNVTNGYIGNVTMPIDGWNQREAGRFSVVTNIPGLTGANGTGALAVLHFHVLGSLGQSSNITLSSGVLSNNLAQQIPAIWIGGFVEVGIIPGDANGDGIVNAVDITKVERIIAHLDTSTPGADANLDGNVNALDITMVERIIVGLN